MIGRALRVVAAIGLIALTGCSSTLGGSPVGLERATGDESAVVSVAQALPDDAAMSATLHSPVHGDRGGVAGFLDLTGAPPPRLDCIGPVFTRMAQAYRGAPVQAATEGWWHTDTPTGGHQADPDWSVIVYVAELDSPANAHQWYAGFTSQWQRCQDTIVTVPLDRDRGQPHQITRVTDSGGVLSADIVLASSSFYQRALTTASRYLIDVQATDLSQHRGAPATVENAVAVAKLVAAGITSPH